MRDLVHPASIVRPGWHACLRLGAARHGAPCIGAGILCFGAAAVGERFTRGALRQRTRIRQRGWLVCHEQGRLVLNQTGPDAVDMPDSPSGLGGRHVCATLLGRADAMEGVPETVPLSGRDQAGHRSHPIP